MDTVNSFKGYGKVDPLEEASFKRKTRKRIVILSVSLILLVVLIVGIVAGVVVHNKNKNSSGDASPGGLSPADALKSICSVTLYPDSCLASLESSNTSEPEKIFRLSLSVVLASLEKLSSVPDEYASRTDDPRVKAALTVCGAALNDAVESLNDTISAVGEEASSTVRIEDLKTWLSTVVTDQDTCLDALGEINATFTNEITLLMRNSTELASNSLAILSKVLSLLGNFKIPSHRRLLAVEESGSAAGFPSWMSGADRRLLQESPPKPDVTVAKDGTGDVQTINEAVARIPKKSNSRFVIYVKAGVYVENVALTKSQWNVMIYGDGKETTIVSGSKNFVDGTPTFSTATFSAVGKGFIARDIAFRNTAGAAKHQAVAFRSGSDQSVFYRCSFDAFQDTLYAHSNRQFYRECDIYGTIDFIFGNSAVVFQSCNILPRQPLPNQFVTITAQGKNDPNQNTGISIQRCTLSAFGNLSAQTYLGRPWKAYSTTVIMQSTIGGFLNPAGWIGWVVGTDPPSTIFYAEYQNTGPGAITAKRVNWAGYKNSLTAAQAARFNVQTFIQGPEWLPATAVAFDST